MRKERCGNESPPHRGFPGGSVSKESACNVGDLGPIPGLGSSPRRRHGNLLQYSSPGESHGQRILVGCSPWGHKESDMTERLTLVLVCGGSRGVGGFEKPPCQAKSGSSFPE